MKFWLLWLVLLLGSKASATTYYVSTIGRDTNPCTSNRAPCATISHAVTLVAAGDTILVHGGTYYEGVRTITSGSSGHLITLKAYGDGTPIIDASETRHFSVWTVYSGNVYKATYTGALPSTCAAAPMSGVNGVVADNVALAAAKQFCDPVGIASVTLSAGQWFYDSNTSILYVYTSDGSNPSGHDLIIPWDVNHTGFAGNISLLNALTVGNWWVVNGLTVRGSANYGVTMGTNSTLTNSAVWFNAWSGTNIGDNSTISNNTVAWNMFANWPRGKCETYNANQTAVGYVSCWIFGGWGVGLGYGAGSTVSGNTSYFNGGEGILSYCPSASCAGGSTVKGNTAYNNWSVNFYVDNRPSYTLDSNLSYCTDPQATWTLNSGASGSIDLLKKLRPIGIFFTDENYGNGAHLSAPVAKNNVVIACRNALQYAGQCCGAGVPGSALINALWAHNTLILPTTNGIDYIDGRSGSDSYNGITITPASGTSTNSGNIIKDNIVYGQGSTNLDVYLNFASGVASGMTGITWDHNLFYHATNSAPFGTNNGSSSTVSYNFANWESALAGLTSSQGNGDVYGDPLFFNLSTTVATDKKLSSSCSGAYHAGVAVTGVARDYLSNVFASPPSIGAFEFNGAPAGGKDLSTPHLASQRRQNVIITNDVDCQTKGKLAHNPILNLDL